LALRDVVHHLIGLKRGVSCVDLGQGVEIGTGVVSSVPVGDSFSILLRRVTEIPPLLGHCILGLFSFRLAITQIELSAKWVKNDRQRKKRGGTYEFRIL
jgi:F0F1-type ATP synthase assembly protein I